MAEPIKPINPVISIMPISSGVTNRDPTGAQSILALMADGSIVRGYVINRDPNGNPILRTSQGDFAVKSEVFIKTGSEVMLRVDSSQASHARILTIDNLSVEEYSAQIPKALTEDTIAPPSLGSTLGTATLTKEQGTPQAHPTLQALVLQANAQRPTVQGSALPLSTPAIPAALAQLAPGMPVNVTVVDVKLPPMPIALSSIPETSSLASLLAPLPQPPANATPSAQPQPLAGALLPQGEQAIPPAPIPTLAPLTTSHSPAAAQAPSPYLNALPPTLVAAQQAAHFTPPFLATASYPQASPRLPNNMHFPASMPLYAPPAPQPGAPAASHSQPETAAADQPTFSATVIGHAEDGANIVHTSFATLKIFTPQPLPSGTVLEIKAEALPTGMPAPINTFSDIPAPAQPSPAHFQDLGSLIAQWSVTNPTLMRALTAQLPVVGPKLTSGLLYFISAVKTGNIRDVLSARALQVLAGEQPELLAKLTRDLATLQQQFVDSPLNDWKPMPLPFLFGSEMTPAHLYIRREGGDGAPGHESNQIGQRFLLDIGFSELGQMQFDGFVRCETKLKSLELFVRSQEPLEGSYCDDIRSIFETATGATGMTGQIVFQHGMDRFVRPQPKAPSVSHAHGAHTILA